MKHIRNIIAVVTLLITASFAVAQGQPPYPPGWGNVKGDRIYAGTSLGVNDSLLSPNQRYLAIFQTDGNFVVYRTSDMRCLWATYTHNRGGNLVALQGDGNLAVYSTWEAPNGYWDSQYNYDTGEYESFFVETGGTHTEYYCLWHAGTNGYSGNFLALQDDGNLVVYTQDVRCLWNIGILDPQPPPPVSTVSYRIDQNGSAKQLWVIAPFGSPSRKVEEFGILSPYEGTVVENNIVISGNTISWILGHQRFYPNGALEFLIKYHRSVTYNPSTYSWGVPVTTAVERVY